MTLFLRPLPFMSNGVQKQSEFRYLVYVCQARAMGFRVVVLVYGSPILECKEEKQYTNDCIFALVE